MNKNNVNKRFSSKLAWDELNSIEKTAVMELVKAIDEVRVEQGELESMEFYINQFRAGLRDALNEVQNES